jgi:hypothetical protein
MKICAVGAEVFHADRDTDMTKLIVAFCNLANAPKIEVARMLKNLRSHASLFKKT